MKGTKLLFMFLFVWTIARCYPTKPLNERSTELTWQAWLLIDESQNKQQDSTLKRRITPKSVFIAPTFSPESLPECSEGYQSDPMGRCIKVIMLNKELHLDFLLQQLNQKFGGMEDYEYEDETTSGPLNINIPLNAVQEETDVAIVVAPTKNIGQSALDKEMDMNKTLSVEKVNVADIAGILGLKQVAEVETTTIMGTDTTTQELTTETTTVNTQGSTSELNALFFLDSKRQVEVKTDTTTLTSTTSNAASTEGYVDSSTTQKRGIQDSELTLYQMDQALPYTDSSVSFVDTKREVVKTKDDPTTTEKITERPPTAFTVRSTLMVPKNRTNSYDYVPPLPRVSTPAPFRKPSHQDTTTASILFTPIDNVLSLEDSTVVPKNTGAVLSTGSQDTFNGNSNNKFFIQLGDSSNETSNSLPIKTDIKRVADFNKIAFPTKGTTLGNTGSWIFSLPSSNRVRFPTSQFSSPPSKTTYSSDRFGVQLQTTSSPNDERNHLKTLSDISPTPLNLTTLYERMKAHRENHRNREKHSEWFHLPTKWSNTSHKPMVLRFSKKNGHMDRQEFHSGFLRQIDARAFGFKPTIQR